MAGIKSAPKFGGIKISNGLGEQNLTIENHTIQLTEAFEFGGHTKKCWRAFFVPGQWFGHPCARAWGKGQRGIMKGEGVKNNPKFATQFVDDPKQVYINHLITKHLNTGFI